MKANQDPPLLAPPKKAQKKDSFTEQLSNAEVQQQEVRHTKPSKQVTIKSGRSSSSQELKLTPKAQSSSHNIQINEFKTQEDEPVTALHQSSTKLNVESKRSSNDSLSPAERTDDRDNMSANNIKIDSMKQSSTNNNQKNNETKVDEQEKFINQANGTLGNHRNEGFDSSQQFQSSTGTPAFNPKDLSDYVQKDLRPLNKYKVQSEK